jgi:hypothetical protein
MSASSALIRADLWRKIENCVAMVQGLLGAAAFACGARRFAPWSLHAPVACPGAGDAPGEPDPRRRQPGPCQIIDMPARIARPPTTTSPPVAPAIRPVLPAGGGVAEALCRSDAGSTCMSGPRAAPAPGAARVRGRRTYSPGPYAPARPPADTGDLIGRRTAAPDRRDRRRTARSSPSCPGPPGDDGGGRAGGDVRSPSDPSQDPWSAVRLPSFT